MRSKLFSAISSASAIALALYLAPVLIDHNSNLNLGSTTFAIGGNGGDGNGGGNGGGNNGGGGNGHGHSADGGEPHSPGHGKNKASQDSLQGNLNAAHASQTARDSASLESMVGKIAAYEQAVLDARNTEGLSPDQRIEAEQAAVDMLADISNKEVNPEVVAAVNELLGLDPAPAAEPETSTEP